MIRLATIFFALLLPSTMSLRGQDLPIPIAELQRDSEVSFADEVMPILKRNCLACHHAKEAEGGLILETIDAIHAGGDSGSSLDTQSPLKSLLLTRTTGEEEPLMPPEDNSVGAQSLTPQELGLLKLWIQQGAKGSEMIKESIEWQEIPESVRTSFAVSVAPNNQFAVVGRGNRTHVFDMLNNAIAADTEANHLIDPDVPGGNASHVDLIQSIAISPDSQWIATGGFRTVKLWKQIPLDLTEKAKTLSAASGLLALNNDDSKVALVNSLGDVEIWNLTNSLLERTLRRHAHTITGLHWIGEDQIISADESGKIVLWNGNSEEPLGEFESKIAIASLAVSEQGHDLAILSVSGTVQRIQLNQETHLFTASAPIESIAKATSVLFYQQDQPVLIISDQSNQVVFLSKENQVLKTIDHGAPVSTLGISHENKQLFTGGTDGKTRVWNAETGEAIFTLESDPQTRLSLAYAERNALRQTQEVDRLNKQTEELEKRLTSEKEVLTKATEEKTKAKTALDEKEKKRTEASNLVAATEAAIKKAMQDTEAAEKLATTSKETLVTATTQGDALAKELEAETVLLTKANAEVEKLKAELASVNEKLKQAQTISQQIQNKVDEKKAGLTKATQQAAAAQIQIDTATKMMNDAKAATEKGTKDIEQQKKDLTKSEEEKEASEADLAKREQAFQTANEAQKRAAAAIPEHKDLIESQARQKERLDQVFTKLKASQTTDSQRVIAIAVSSEQKLIATAHADDSIRVYQTETGSPISRFHRSGNRPTSGATGLTWIGSEIVEFGNQPSTNIWASDSQWRLVRTIGSPDDPTILSDRITAMDFRNDGLSLAVGSGAPSREGEVKVFSVQTGRMVRDFGSVHSDTVLGLRFSPKGDLLASSAADKTVRLLDLANGKVTRSLEGHTHHVLAIAWQDDEHSIASASADRTVKIWDTQTGEQRRTITGFGKEITALTYVAATNQLASSCADGQARLHDTSNGKALRTFNASGDFLYALSVSLDGKTMVTSGQSGALRIWNVDDGKLIQELK